MRAGEERNGHMKRSLCWAIGFGYSLMSLRDTLDIIFFSPFFLFHLSFFDYDCLIETKPLGPRVTHPNEMTVKMGHGETAEDAYERQRCARGNQGRLQRGGDF